MELLEFLELSRFFGKVQQVTGKHCPVKLLTFGQSNKKDLKARNCLQCNQGSSLWPTYRHQRASFSKVIWMSSDLAPMGSQNTGHRTALLLAFMDKKGLSYPLLN